MTPPGLPALDADSAAHRNKVERWLVEELERAPYGFMPFEQWMNLALYAPGLGYYAAGNTKFGGSRPEGDFTTAPELSPLFGQVLARQAAQVLRLSQSVQVLEFGAGSGALAAALIPALRQLGIEPVYQILEVSADLRARQQKRLGAQGLNAIWLDALPDEFSGCVLANEVLDAMPVTLFRWGESSDLFEIGVSLGCEQESDREISLRHRRSGGIEASLGRARIDHASTGNAQSAQDADTQERGTPFVLTERQASAELLQRVGQRMPPLPEYQSEINLQAEAWVRQMGNWLKRGAALLIDYGFPQREYYHPQRVSGTLMCHFRHHAHSQPLINAGLQDITAHVDFTAMADAALEGGLDVLGYTSQARFLMNSGLTELLSSPAREDRDERLHAQTMAAVQTLVSEAEMGELFKVLAVGRGLDQPLSGFANGDRRHRL